jgi:hypothetical protein
MWGILILDLFSLLSSNIILDDDDDDAEISIKFTIPIETNVSNIIIVMFSF